LKQAYEKRIAEIKAANEKAIRKLVDEFKINLLKVQEEMKESQHSTQHLKVNYEKKLVKQDEEHEYEVIDNFENHKNMIKNLDEQWKTLEGKQKKRASKKEILD
jgi:hypothetical protein